MGEGTNLMVASPWNPRKPGMWRGHRSLHGVEKIPLHTSLLGVSAASYPSQDFRATQNQESQCEQCQTNFPQQTYKQPNDKLTLIPSHSRIAHVLSIFTDILVTSNRMFLVSSSTSPAGNSASQLSKKCIVLFQPATHS